MSPRLDKALSDAQAEAEMLARRGFPQLAQKIAQQPLSDWANGRITDEHFKAIMAEQAAADLVEREAKYGPGPLYEDLYCTECSTALEWDRADHDDEPPPLWPTCEDVTGTDCTECDDEDEDEPS